MEGRRRTEKAVAPSEDEWEEEAPPRGERPRPYLGTRHELAADEHLEVDNSAYRTLFRAEAEWPCLSFDFLALKGETAGPPRYPLDVGVVAASQADEPSSNALYLLRFADVGVTQFDDDEATPEDSFDDSEPALLGLRVSLPAAVNRVRTLPTAAVVALMSESAELLLVDLRHLVAPLQALTRDAKGLTPAVASMAAFPLGVEGFGLGWSGLRDGEIAAGTVDGALRHFALDAGQSTWQEARKWRGHHSAVEDIAFSPTDGFALATCSADQHLIVHDLRTGKPALAIHAHTCDVNALTWNARSPVLLATGGEDGVVRVWDLRSPSRPPLSHLAWHAQPVVSLDWAPHDEWTLVVGCADDRVSVWDLSVEPEGATPAEVPDQLLFVHQGMEELREAAWHPRLHNLAFCTAASGFHLFEPALDDALSTESETGD